MNRAASITIKNETCTLCGLCAEVCPIPVIRKDGNMGMRILPDRTPLCISCGQCMAVCPVEAITVEGLDYLRDFFPLPSDGTVETPFLKMIQTRRSIRVFKDTPVPRKVLEKVVQAIAFAPPGFPPLKTELVVVEDRGVIRRALPEIITFYDKLITAMRNPIARFFIRRNAGPSTFTTLENHVVPLMKSRLSDLKGGVNDTITRNAQAMLLFHAARNAENYETDIHIALTYGLLIAHELGLGATAIDLIPPAIEHSPALRRLFSIPDGNVVVSSMVLGYPRYRYQRSIKRDLKSVTWL